MKRCEFRAIVWMAWMIAFAPVSVVQAQVVNGTILGTVRDSSGGVIPQVNVSARNVNTGAVRTASTDALGAYQILSVPAGDYEVEAGGANFKTSVRKGIGVTVGASTTVNFDLAVGDVQQRVEVEATAPQLESNNASMG
jgi:hypothetical protein